MNHTGCLWVIIHCLWTGPYIQGNWIIAVMNPRSLIVISIMICRYWKHCMLSWWQLCATNDDSDEKVGIIMMTSSNGNIFALLALCEGNPPLTGGFPSQGPVTRSFDMRLNKRLNKQSRHRWLGKPSRWFWRHGNDENSRVSVILWEQCLSLLTGISIIHNRPESDPSWRSELCAFKCQHRNNNVPKCAHGYSKWVPYHNELLYYNRAHIFIGINLFIHLGLLCSSWRNLERYGRIGQTTQNEMKYEYVQMSCVGLYTQDPDIFMTSC